MDTVKFDEKSLSRFPVAFYFSAVEAFGKRIGAAECSLERFLRMREEYDVLFKQGKRIRQRENFRLLTAWDELSTGGVLCWRKKSRCRQFLCSVVNNYLTFSR